MSYRLLPFHQRLSNALTHDEFRIYYQPVVSLQNNNEVVGMEALCRWPQRDNTMTAPDQFIPQAENSGFIIQLGEWVMRTACKQVNTWQEQFGRKLRLAVNLSSRQFLHHGLFAMIQDALRQSKLDPHDLDLEITEGVAMHNAEDSIGVMRQIKSIGCGLSLDDFGTGYSSLSYLKRFPLDLLKIDKSFVRDIPADQNDMAIVSAITAMAHALNLGIIAEGVETQAQGDFLRDCGVAYAQGYYFGRPLPESEFEEMLSGLGKQAPRTTA
ncbi:MAG: EAL domain-containing protein [Candidatus Eremiobacteraeota bacterium]|nr:EAL domain-containing protein [Candidatus Eremiobacteraeota bacterium]